MPPLRPVPPDAVRSAQRRLAGTALRTPLVRLNVEEAPAEIYLKLETLQPVGSFKMRGLGNAVLKAAEAGWEGGVWTVSAGNAAQGLAWYARHVGLECTVVVPEQAPETKLDALRRLGARIRPTPPAEVWEVTRTGRCEGVEGRFVHPFADPDVMAGNGTIGLEVVEDLPGVDALVVPFGGGGLSCGIASAVRAVAPAAAVYGAEVETAAPLRASLEAGEPREVEATASFVDGIGAPLLFPEMWPLARQLLTAAVVVSLEQVAAAIRLLVERHRIVAEGAGASSLAAALTGEAGRGKVVAVVSGGNLDAGKLATILRGGVPQAAGPQL